VASPGSGAREAQNYMKLFVAHEMTQNNTVNKVHVAATELPQLLSQNTNMFGKSLKKNKLLEVEGARAPVLHSWRRRWEEGT